MDLYYKFSMLEPLGYELRTKMNGNVLKAILFCFVPVNIYCLIIIIMLLNLYERNSVERSTQMH
jgi:hypothetical protein